MVVATSLAILKAFKIEAAQSNLSYFWTISAFSLDSFWFDAF